MVCLKGFNLVMSKSIEEKLDGGEVEKKFDFDNEGEKSLREVKKFFKIWVRLKMEFRNFNSLNSDKKENVKELNKDFNVKYIYLFVFMIGNNIYFQICGKELEFIESGVRLFMDSGRIKCLIVNFIDKFFDFSNVFIKLGYMKLIRNVVYFGGGFFGCYQEKWYMDFWRFVFFIDNFLRLEVVKSEKGFYGFMN